MNYTTLEINIPDDELELLNQAVELAGVTMDQYIADVLWKTLYTELEERYKKLEGLIPDVLEALDTELGGNDFSDEERDCIYDTLQKVKQVDEELNHRKYMEGGF